MNKNLLADAIRRTLMRCFLLLAVITSFCLSAVTAQIKPPPRAGQLKDVIVSSEGVREGKLAGCVAGVCSMDNVTTFRIVRIGLKVNTRTPPAPTDPTGDEVRYHDGSVHPGRLVGINADLVVTERGRHQRAMVAWVYLAPRREPTAPGQIGAPPPTPLPSPATTPTPTRTPAPTPGSTVPLGITPGAKRGGLWTGKITGRWIQRYRVGEVLRITTTIDDLRLREYVQPMHIVESGKLRIVGTMTSLVAEGGKISERHRDLNNVGRDGSYCYHSGEGTTTLTGADISSSYIWKKNGSVDTTTGVGWNVPSGPGLYTIELHPLGGYTRSGFCVGMSSIHKTLVTKPEKKSFLNFKFGRTPASLEPIDPELRFLDSTGSRMIGTNTQIIRGGSWTVSWSICREGVKCASPPTAGDGAISLGNIFETDLAMLRDSEADPKLAGVVSKMEADPSLMPEIRVILKGGGDPIFLEVMAKARIEQLKAWFAEHGVDASRIDWAWETTGASDEVVITY